jgi:DNA-binding transcriptional regulator YiaG
MAEYVVNTWLETETCCNCGMVFAMPKDFQQKKRNNPGSTFYCPSGHGQHYVGETKAQKLQRELEQRESQLADARDQANRLMAERDAAAKAHKKMRTRVANGVCPCCNRSFENLRNHMQSQHPEYGEQQTLYALRTAFGMTQHQVADEAGVRAVGYVSNYERGKPVPAEAKQRLNAWIERQGIAA